MHRPYRSWTENPVNCLFNSEEGHELKFIETVFGYWIYFKCDSIQTQSVILENETGLPKVWFCFSNTTVYLAIVKYCSMFRNSSCFDVFNYKTTQKVFEGFQN